MENALIQTQDLIKKYRNRVVTNSLNETVFHDDFTVIMGSSGSGKSTLLYLLSGLEQPTSGQILYGQKNIVELDENETAMFRRTTAGFVFQAMHLVPSITVLENLLVPGGLLERDYDKLHQRATSLLKQFNVDAHANKYPAELSGGEQQRVAIARAMINMPKVLFADEPTGALNSSQGENVLDVLTKLHQQGQSIIMVTHDIKAAARATRILFLKDGTIDGTLTLSPYEDSKKKNREDKIFEFLQQKGW